MWPAALEKGRRETGGAGRATRRQVSARLRLVVVGRRRHWSREMRKPSNSRSTSTRSPGQVAEAVVELTLLVSPLVTPELRRSRPKHLTLSQLRPLDFLAGHPDSALSAVADYVGLALPSTSALGHRL